MAPCVLEGCLSCRSRLLMGPALLWWSYELFSRMAGAAPRWPRARSEGSFVGRGFLLRCCLAPGDSGRLLEFPGLPVTTGTAATGGLSFTENQNLFCPGLMWTRPVRCEVTFVC